jgi:hypothetical protein
VDLVNGTSYCAVADCGVELIARGGRHGTSWCRVLLRIRFQTVAVV